MATSVITGKILDNAGTAIQYVKVRARLIPRPAHLTATGAELVVWNEYITDVNGEYAMTLTNTADITPAGSVYEVIEFVSPRYGGAVKHIIQVAGDNTLLASVISFPPTAVTQSYLTQAAADLRYVLAPASYGAVGDISTIDPDDAASAGVLTSFARADHQHRATTATAADLTLTATESEGVASTLARSDHVHGTALLPWGFVARADVSANPAAFSSQTDLTGATITFTSTGLRRYKITAHVLFTVSVNAAQCHLRLIKGSTVVQESATSVVASGGDETTGLVWTDVPVAGSVTYKLAGARTSGMGSMTTSIDGTRPDFILIEDIGPA